MTSHGANISVIIPAYNRAGLIGKTLRSLLSQTVPAKEIIVVDDGSEDGTAETVLEMLELGEAEKLKISEGKPWPHFKVLRQANAGPGTARNRGLREATGEFIHFFDSDDIAARNKHEVQLRALLETGADIAYGPWCKGRFAGEEARRVANGKWRVASLKSENTGHPLPAALHSGFIPEGPVLQARGLPKGSLIKALLTNWSIVPHACLFRSSIVEKVGGFAEESFGYEDQFMFLRCLLAGGKVVHSPGTLEFYRVDNPGKLTESGERQRKFSLECARFLVQAKKEVEKREWFVFHPPNKIVLDPFDKQTKLVSPVEWFGYRLKAYEAWVDLEKFFPGEMEKAKEDLEGIFLNNRKFRKAEMQKYLVAGFVLRKLGGLKQRLVGHRWSQAYRCENFSTFMAKCGFGGDKNEVADR